MTFKVMLDSAKCVCVPSSFIVLAALGFGYRDPKVGYFVYADDLVLLGSTSLNSTRLFGGTTRCPIPEEDQRGQVKVHGDLEKAREVRSISVSAGSCSDTWKVVSVIRECR